MFIRKSITRALVFFLLLTFSFFCSTPQGRKARPFASPSPPEGRAESIVSWEGDRGPRFQVPPQTRPPPR